ncbi:MAG: sigma-54-dependent Fis family transcriptional regulator [Candidatus Cloacimonetes bacterium]|nr:sigma-54-dependent Fis family transcriptional regulator [Candidatus Cloacimonadota bacterium]
MDKNEFFRQATLQICCDLDIEKALFSTLHFLRQIMPVDWMSLQLYEKDLKAMRTIAIATLKEAKSVNLLTSLSTEAQQQIERKIRLKSRNIKCHKVNHKTEKLYKDMFHFHGIKATSFMVLALESNEGYIGSVGLVSQSENLFHQKHFDLICLLKETFMIAMSNTLRYREIAELKDLLKDDNKYLYKEIRQLTGDDIIGANFGLKDVMEKVRRVAALDSPVLLLGETGVGKDVIANAIHNSSLRKNGPFIKVNCGAIPESLIDSELFGYEKGAFTGAIKTNRGRFERANKGTIFLDEIGDLPLQSQVRLLRVLQDKEIERVGGNKIIKLDIRIISATNRNLEEMIKSNQFREDLWFRLNVFPIQISPLRERKSDIPALLQYFISKKAKELKLPNIPKLTPGAIEPIINYDWPGNVRELENVVERALILNPHDTLSFEHLNRAKVQENLKPSNQNKEMETLDVVTSRYIKRTLTITKGKINGPDGAAEILGINPNTLRNRMKKLGIVYGMKSKNR